MSKTPAISGIDREGRLECFINGTTVHVPLSGVLTVENLDALGIAPTVSARLAGVTANTTVTIPAGWAIQNIFIVNTSANAVAGGVKIGTTSGGTDVAEAIAVGANAIVDSFQSLDWHLKKRLFSTTVNTTVFIQAVTAWNGANLSIAIQRTKVF